MLASRSGERARRRHGSKAKCRQARRQAHGESWRTQHRRHVASRLSSTPDEFLTLENTRAEKSIPAELAAAAASQRVSIHVPKTQFEPRGLTESREAPNTWELDLPPGAGLVMPGQRAGRMSVQEVARGIKGSSDSESIPATMGGLHSRIPRSSRGASRCCAASMAG
jgi:hypothetical protein